MTFIDSLQLQLFLTISGIGPVLRSKMEKNSPIVTLVVISGENDPNFIGSRFIIATWISSRKNTKFCKEVRSITLAENFICMLVKMIMGLMACNMFCRVINVLRLRLSLCDTRVLKA